MPTYAAFSLFWRIETYLDGVFLSSGMLVVGTLPGIATFLQNPVNMK